MARPEAVGRDCRAPDLLRPATYSVAVPSPTPTPRPRLLFLAAAVLGLEALACIAYGAVEATRIDSARIVVGAGVTLLMLGYGAALIAVSRGVALGRRWARGPAVSTQVLQLLLAFSFGQGATLPVGLALGAAAVVVLGCLLTPAATEVFSDTR
jgi:hypothetical protein